jgi:16S rRNA C967 or C1407 C5-methylase (RsmB/RsmF family)
MLQNVCSLVTAQVLGPPPGARVLDMCAAPGGKTTAIAQLMNNQGEVRCCTVLCCHPCA